MEFLQHINHILFLISGLILLVYYLHYLLALNFRPKSNHKEPSYPAVSVIIAYKNEYQNLKFHLDHWLAQDYPEFEIVLVNDHSVDEGPEYLKFRELDKLKLLDLKKGSGKKAAVNLGVSEAEHEFLLLTDADCKPMSSQWIKEMLRPLIEEKQIVVGYSGFYAKLSLLNLIQRYENCVNALQNAAMIRRGRAYMAVGRNMAYQAKLMVDLDNRSSISVRSGDDDLLVNQLSKAGNTEFVGQIEAQTISEATANWKRYFFQRRRQLEAGKFYKTADRIKLAMLGISQLLFNLLFIKHLLTMEYLSIILSIFVIKLILQLLISYQPMKRLGEVDLWWQSPILEIIYLPIISLIGISQYLYKVDRWK